MPRIGGEEPWPTTPTTTIVTSAAAAAGQQWNKWGFPTSTAVPPNDVLNNILASYLKGSNHPPHRLFSSSTRAIKIYRRRPPSHRMIQEDTRSRDTEVEAGGL
jgi:hypothetical protein